MVFDGSTQKNRSFQWLNPTLGPVYNDPPQTPGPVYGTPSYNNPVYSPGDRYQQPPQNQFRQPSSNQPMSNVAVKQMKPPETPSAMDYQAQTVIYRILKICQKCSIIEIRISSIVVVHNN